MSDSIYPLKRCTKCQQQFPATPEFFNRKNSSKSGLCTQCKNCTRETVRRWHKLNPDKVYTIKRRWRKANPEKTHESGRKWRERYPEKIRAGNKRRLERNPERERQRQRANSSNYSARELAAEGTHTAEDVALQIKAQTNKKGKLICWLCGKPIKGKYHVDHWIPLSKQGSNDAGNLRILHERCNFSKNDKLPWQLGRLI